MPHGQIYDKVMSNLAGDQGPRRPGDRRGRRGRHARSAGLADDVIEVPAVERVPAADRHGDPLAALGLPHRRRPRLRRRQAAEPGQERDGGVESRPLPFQAEGMKGIRISAGDRLRPTLGCRQGGRSRGNAASLARRENGTLAHFSPRKAIGLRPCFLVLSAYDAPWTSFAP